MAAITMIAEAEATGAVAELYDDMKATLGIDFVPHLYRVMAVKPEYLAANWAKVKAVMVAPGKLDRLTKEIVAMAVSAVNGCAY
jgi:alkylhydroperoxidase family enzyme